MHVGFKITLEDGSTIQSHDESWNEIKAHAHALFPHNNKKWVTYEIITDAKHSILVNFITGVFVIDGVTIHPADQDNEIILTGRRDLQEFPVAKEWAILNGLPYFPVVGKRTYKGDMFEAQLFYCGWKRKVPNWKRKDSTRTVTKLAFFNPANGVVILT